MLPFEGPLQVARRRPRGRSPHRTSEASLNAFELIRRRRSKLYLPILELLSARGPRPEECLTAREILRELKLIRILPPLAERNQVSPRLNELLNAGCVENPALVDPAGNAQVYLKRVLDDAPAMTWRVTGRGHALLDHLKQERKGEHDGIRA
jgi:hypothetical protein